MRGVRLIPGLAAVAIVGAVLILDSPSQATPTGRFTFVPRPGGPVLSGVADPSFLTGSDGVTGSVVDGRVAGLATDDVQINGDNKANASDQFGGGEGLPANETSIAINPTDPNNVIAGANDYESGVDSVMGVYVSFDGGHTWPYSRHTRQIITPDRRMLGSG
ncbi:MAG: hypothetical protein ACRD0U_18645, partial [Acidimicrobiales bacterium]